MSLYSETLGYLGWRGQELDGALKADIEGAIRECEALAAPRHVWRVFNLEGQRLSGTALSLTGNSMARLLQGSEKAAVMAVTLGHPLDAELRRRSETAVSRALLLDAAASALAEAACDRAEAEIKAWAREHELASLPRFSPGYGDLPLDVQPKILALLDASRKIGLHCTAGNLLLPRKSVTAIVALPAKGRLPHILERTCANCVNGENCPYSSCVKKV